MKPATASWSSTAPCASLEPSAALSTSSPSSAARLSRRGLLLGVGALACLPGPALAAAGQRRFKLFRGRSEVGAHTLSAAIEGDRLVMRINIDIRVRVLGITAYRYAHSNTEIWRDGRLASIDATTDDDGDKAFVRVRRSGEALTVNASGYQGAAPGDAVPTSYWFYDAAFATRKWISTQSGELFSMNFAKSPWNGAGEQVAVTGGFETQLFYDAAREWRGSRFDARGTPIEYRETQPGPDFRPLVAG